MMISEAQRFIKDANATLDYEIDWSQWLAAGDSIVTSTWSVESGLTTSNESNTATLAIVWLSGGVVGNMYLATNHIITSAGRVDERSLLIKIQEL